MPKLCFQTAGAIQVGDVVRLQFDSLTNTARVRSVLPDPSFIWTQQSLVQRTTDKFTVNDVACDCDGNVYVLAPLKGNATVGTISLSTIFATPVIIKYDYNGKLLFVASSVVTSADADGGGLTVDCDGTITFDGSFGGTIQFGTLPPLTTTTGNQDAFVVQMSSTGTFLWSVQTQGGNPHSALASDIAGDCVGNTYITGIIQGSAVISFGTFALTPIGTGANLFVAKLNANGTFLWAQQSTTSNNGTVNVSVITNDCQQRVFTTSTILTGNAIFQTPNGSVTISSAAFEDFFVAVSSGLDGQFLRVVQSHASANLPLSRATSNDIASDCRGNVFVTGAFAGVVLVDANILNTSPAQDQSFVVQLNFNLDFVRVCQSTGDANNTSTARSLALDQQGNVFVTGLYHGAGLFFGEQQLATQIMNTLFVAKLTNDLQWVQVIASVGQSSNSLVVGFAASANFQGDIFVGGLLQGISTIGSATVGSVGRDFFVTKVCSDNTIPLLGIAETSTSNGHRICPRFVGVVTAPIYRNLIPGFAYYLDRNKTLVAACECTFCSNNDLRYIGTAISSVSLLLQD